MYIDFEDSRPETPRLERALSVREGVLISIIVHLLGFIALLVPARSSQRVPAEAVAAEVARRANDTPVRLHAAPRRCLEAAADAAMSMRSDQDRVHDRASSARRIRRIRCRSRGGIHASVRKPRSRRPNRGTAPESSVAQGKPNASTEGQMANNDPARSMLRLPDMPSAAPGLRHRRGWWRRQAR